MQKVYKLSLEKGEENKYSPKNEKRNIKTTNTKQTSFREQHMLLYEDSYFLEKYATQSNSRSINFVLLFRNYLPRKDSLVNKFLYLFKGKTEFCSLNYSRA